MSGDDLDVPPEVVFIDYTNWKGSRRVRPIRPLSGTLKFTATPHHPEVQWVFRALDMEDPERPERTFALRDIHEWRLIP